MLSKAEVAILDAVQTSGRSFVDVLNGFDPEHKCRVTNAVMDCFLAQGLISIFPPAAKPPVCYVRLSSSAVQLILLYEEEQRKQAEETAKLEKRIQEQHELEEWLAGQNPKEGT